MQKTVYLTITVVLVVAILVAGFKIFDYSMIPKVYRHQSISFINQSIKWSDSINRVKSRLGECSVTTDSFNDSKTYKFQSSYAACPVDIFFKTPFHFSKHISDVTYVFHASKDTYQVIHEKIKEELKNECRQRNIPIETDNERIFEASKSDSIYAITYTVSSEDADIILNISLQY